MHSQSEALPVVNWRLRRAFAGVNYKARWAMHTRCPRKEQICNTDKKGGAPPLDLILARRFCNKEVLLRVMKVWEGRLREYERKEREEQLQEWELENERRRESGHEAGLDPPAAPTPRPLPRPTKIPRRLLRTPPGEMPGVDPFARFLVQHFSISPDADNSYALRRGAADGNYELVEWMLSLGAKVTKNEDVAFKAAIMNNDIKMLRLLIEPEGSKLTNKPRPDRIQCQREWVDLALKNKAYDVVHWLVDEKGECVYRAGLTPGLTPSLDRILGLQPAGYDPNKLQEMMAKAPPIKKREQAKLAKKKAGEC